MRATQKMEIIKLGKKVADLEQSYENSDLVPALRKITSEGLHRIAHYLGVTVFAISATAFLGRILQTTGLDQSWLYRWYYDDVGMAFNTSIVFMVISAIMLILATLIKRNEKKP